jgi:hypothetical protein
MNGLALDAAAYSAAIGSSSAAARYIGRASVLTNAAVGADPLPWFGYIGGVRVFDTVEAVLSVPPGREPAGALNFGATPNPVTDAAAIRFTLPARSEVTLRVHDVAGRQIRTLLNANSLEAGDHTLLWDGRSDRGDRPRPGVYFYRLVVSGTVAATDRTILLGR